MVFDQRREINLGSKKPITLGAGGEGLLNKRQRTARQQSTSSKIKSPAAMKYLVALRLCRFYYIYIIHIHLAQVCRRHAMLIAGGARFIL